ncbi:MAG TPA: hypothetical protein VGP82_05290 [Ktedonobacterales bacterium]|jgi:hypothetical protein|nr:hypothetical protein [Ktedonobacterales bacterium]
MTGRAGIRGTLCLFGVMIALVAMLAGCGGSSTGGASTSGGTSTSGGQTTGCVAGVKEINGVNTRQFCGSAKAQATAGSQMLSWSDGDCQKVNGTFTVNIGRIVLGIDDAAKALKKQYDYFGITLEATKDGTYKNAALAFDYKGEGYALISNTLTLSGNLTKGTFSGRDLTNGAVSGSFNC